MDETSVASARARRRRRWWATSAALAAGGAAVVAGMFAQQALAVRDDLAEAKSALAGIMAEVRSGADATAVQTDVDQVSTLTARAREIVGGPLWTALSGLPAVGQNVAAVRDVTAATDILVQDALPLGVEAMGAIDPSRLVLDGGGIDLAPFAAAEGTLPGLDSAFARAQREVAGIDRSTLLPIVDDSIAQVLDVIETAAPSVSTLKQYLPTLLQMAGADGPRRYLVVFQNNAENRATGGNPAASLVITVDGGRMSMGEQADSSDFPVVRTDPYTGLPAETATLYEGDTLDYPANFTRTPDFPTTARLFRDALVKQTGRDVDGVISIDPVVLSGILAVTGLVEVDGQRIDAGNATASLLSDPYRRFDTQSQADPFFARTAAAVFARITAGGWDPVRMLETLGAAAKDQRVYLWSAHDAEQRFAESVGISGSLAATPADDLELGIYLNDASWGKIGYYLSSSVSVTCDPSAGTTATSITLTNSVPTADLKDYVLALRAPENGLARTTIMEDVLFIAPPGSSILSSSPASSDLGPQWDRSGADNGRQGASRLITIPMGESRTVTFTSSIPEGARVLSVRTTPLVGTTPVTVDASCDALRP